MLFVHNMKTVVLFIYLFIFTLFNEAVPVASNERMTGELWAGKNMEGSGSGLI
jgi:hypothetical protein